MGEVGDILADVFVMVSSTSSIYVQLCIKCIFNHDVLTENIINGMSKQLSAVQSSNAIKSNDANGTKTNVSNGLNGPKQSDDGNDIDHKHQKGNGPNGSDQQPTKREQYVKKNDVVEHKKNGMNLCHLMHPSLSTWNWMIDNKFSLLSMSAAGLMLSAATKGKMRDC